MTTLFRLAALSLTVAAAAPAHADTLIINPDSMHPGLELVVIPADSGALQTAQRAHLPTGSMAWSVARVPLDRHAGLEPSPFQESRRLDLMDPDELLGISGIPVMLEGDGRVGSASTMVIVPSREGLAVHTTSANPTPYPYPSGPIAARLPELVAWPAFDGWSVASTADGIDRGLAGIAPVTWVIDGVEVRGIGVLVGADGPGAVLGEPMLKHGEVTVRATGLHLVHL